MPRRIALTVNVNLDPVEGTFHDEEDACRQVQWILDQAIPHYVPGVSLFTSQRSNETQGQVTLPLGDWRHKPNWVRDDYYKLPDRSTQLREHGYSDSEAAAVLKQQNPETD